MPWKWSYPARSFEIFLSEACAAAPNCTEVRANAPAGQQNRVRKENSNEETAGHAGICFYFRWGGSDCGMWQSLHEENERYVFVAQILICHTGRRRRRGF